MRLRHIRLLAGVLLALAGTGPSLFADDGPELPGFGGSDSAPPPEATSSPPEYQTPEPSQSHYQPASTAPSGEGEYYQGDTSLPTPNEQPPKEPARTRPALVKPKGGANITSPKVDAAEARAKAAREAWMRRQTQQRAVQPGAKVAPNSGATDRVPSTSVPPSSRATSPANSRARTNPPNGSSVRQPAPREPEPSTPWREDVNWGKRGMVKGRPAANQPYPKQANPNQVNSGQARPQAQAQLSDPAKPKAKTWAMPTWPGKPRASSNARPTQR